MPCLVVWAIAPRGSAQIAPSLGLKYSAGYPALTITGTVGIVYSIQYANDLFPTNLWADRTLLQVQAAGNSWTDPSARTAGQRFYRAVSVPAPANTNLVFIQPGTFRMGSPNNEIGRVDNEGPQTEVTISRGFWIGKYEVTQSEYEAVIGKKPSFFAGNPNHAVEQVNWYDATNYCGRLTQQERAVGRIATNWAYRLPTEAEWEYACRASSSTRFSYGDDPGHTNLTKYAWYSENSDRMTHTVGQKLANAWGLFDIHGNVWEWCQDWFGVYPGGSVIDPQGPASGSSRVIRGGSWNLEGTYCRAAYRNIDDPGRWRYFTGFRVVLAAEQP